jgi:hypothetical protein
MGFPAINPAIQFFDDSGAPLSGGLLFSYVPSTSTKKDTWTNAELNSLNTNPIELDNAGRCSLFLADGEEYKFVLSPANDTDPPTNPIWTRDKVMSPEALSGLTQADIGGLLYPRTTAEIDAGVTPTAYAHAPYKFRRQGALGNASADDGSAIEASLTASGEALAYSDAEDGFVYHADTYTRVDADSTVKVRGNSTIRGPAGGTTAFVKPNGTLRLEGLSFDRWGNIAFRAIADAGAIPRMVLDSLLTDSIGAAAFYFEVPVSNYRVSFNEFEDHTAGYPLRVGRNIFAEQDGWEKGWVLCNSFKDISETGANDLNGMLIYGKELLILGNYLENITNGTGELAAIYTKARFNTIAFNVVDTVTSGSATSQGINAKGSVKGNTATPQGYATRIIANHVQDVVGTPTGGYGARLQCDHGLLIGNTVADSGDSNLVIDADQAGANVLALGNIEWFDAAADTHVGARISAGTSRINYSHNISDGSHAGVRLAALAGTETDWLVSHNLLNADVAASSAGVIVRRDANLAGLTLAGNVVTDAALGLRFEAGSGVLSRVRILDNDLDGATTPFSGTLPADLQLRHCFKFQTTAAGPTTALTLTLPDESAYMVELRAVGMQSDGSNRAMYHREALVYRDGGGATLQGAVQDLGTPVESDANWNATIAVSGNTITIPLTGVAATTINWKLSINVLAVG